MSVLEYGTKVSLTYRAAHPRIHGHFERKGILMYSALVRSWISRVSRRPAGAVLALPVLLLPLVAVTPAAQAQTFSLLYSFTGAPDGAYPYAGVIEDSSGTLYGTTYWAGAGNEGTVFELNSSGAESVLYSFRGSSDGYGPYATVARDGKGNLYGTTPYGGTSYYGVLFEVDTAGKETVLHNFADGTGGDVPYGGLLLDKSGNLYGTTAAGGAFNYGTIFKLSKDGNYTVLHSFAGPPTDGGNPTIGNLIMDRKGSLYGVTAQGGSSGYGAVYRLTNDAQLAVLYSFSAASGVYPTGTLARDKSGNLYGTTKEGGAYGVGTVWKLSARGTEKTLHDFDGGTTDGESPYPGVVLDAEGNLYGDTYEGGASDYGTVYEVSNTGEFTLLHSFTNYPSDGATPYGSLLLDAQGALVGTTYAGGAYGWGTVWKLTP